MTKSMQEGGRIATAINVQHGMRHHRYTWGGDIALALVPALAFCITVAIGYIIFLR